MGALKAEHFLWLVTEEEVRGTGWGHAGLPCWLPGCWWAWNGDGLCSQPVGRETSVLPPQWPEWALKWEPSTLTPWLSFVWLFIHSTGYLEVVTSVAHFKLNYICVQGQHQGSFLLTNGHPKLTGKTILSSSNYIITFVLSKYPLTKCVTVFYVKLVGQSPLILYVCPSVSHTGSCFPLILVKSWSPTLPFFDNISISIKFFQWARQFL